MITDLIKPAALKYGIDEHFLYALVSTESNFNPNVIRFERDYKYLYEINKCKLMVGCTMDTMINMQRTSWGLCQIMGALYYELGGTNWCTMLLDPEINLKFACEHIHNIIDRQKITSHKELYASYNSGYVRYMKDGTTFVNQSNVDRFMKTYMLIKKNN